MASVIKNTGTQDINNLTIKYDFPAGIKVHTIYMPLKKIVGAY